MTSRKYLILLFIIAISIKSYSQPYFENRADIPEKYTWDLTVLFEDWNIWKSFYNETETLVSKIVVRDSFCTANELYESMYALDTIGNRIDKLAMYAMMQANVNQKDEFAEKQRYKAMVLPRCRTSPLVWPHL
ncbi:MAG: hypothetical protein JEZ09_14625 [Salinivirgaceae bacterium]|nr:hypothetical protein [Salinivirgaceae bacterium]